MRLKRGEREGGANGKAAKRWREAGKRFEEVVGSSVDKDTVPYGLSAGARNDRVRHFGRRARRYSDTRDHAVPTEAAGALDRDRRGDQRPVGRASGQSTVEFAIVTAGFLAATVALGAMWRVFGGGVMVEHALAVASHHTQAVAPTTLADLFLY